MVELVILIQWAYKLVSVKISSQELHALIHLAVRICHVKMVQLAVTYLLDLIIAAVVRVKIKNNTNNKNNNNNSKYKII